MIGKKVRLKDLKTLVNFAGYLEIKGKIIKYDPQHKTGLLIRPYGVQFEDRPGVYWYAKHELVLLGD